MILTLELRTWLPRRASVLAAIAASGAIAVVAAAPTADAATEVLAARVIESGIDGALRPTVVTGVALSPDGRSVAAASDDHAVRIWDTATGQLRAELRGHRDWVRTVAISPDGGLLASGGNDHYVSFWNTSTGARLFDVPALGGPVAAVSFHPNGQQLAIAGFCDKLVIVNTSSGQLSQQLDCPSSDLRAIAFSPEGTRMAVAGRNGQIRLWNVTSGLLERDIAAGRQRIRALAFSPDGAGLAYAGDADVIRVLDLASNHEVALPARPAKVHAAVFLDAHSLATGGSDNRIHVWDLESRMVTKELVGHTGSVAALACDATGQTLVSGSYDTTLRVWKLHASGSYPSMAKSLGEEVR